MPGGDLQGRDRATGLLLRIPALRDSARATAHVISPWREGEQAPTSHDPVRSWGSLDHHAKHRYAVFRGLARPDRRSGSSFHASDGIALS